MRVATRAARKTVCQAVAVGLSRDEVTAKPRLVEVTGQCGRQLGSDEGAGKAAPVHALSLRFQGKGDLTRTGRRRCVEVRLRPSYNGVVVDSRGRQAWKSTVHSGSTKVASSA